MLTACEDIDDIEDLIAAGDLMPSDRYYNKKDVIVRGKNKKTSNGIPEQHRRTSNGISEQSGASESVRQMQSF